MWWIIGYLIGVIASWFIIAYQRDWCDDRNRYYDKIPAILMFLGPIFILVSIISIIIISIIELFGKLKIFNPSLKHFKKNDKHREK